MPVNGHSTERARVVVSGMLASVPHYGGATWAVLQYLLGLERLGHDVWFVEPVDSAGAPPGADRYFERIRARFGLGQAGVVVADQPVPAPLADALRTADVLLDLAGTMRAAPNVFAAVDASVRAYVDLDPAFTQLWSSVDGIDMGFDDHTHFVTVGLDIGSDDCDIPTCDRQWIGTLPPVVLDQWPVADTAPTRGFTTIASWRAYGSTTWRGTFYGQKCHSFRRLAHLPETVGLPVSIAADVHPDEPDLARLQHEGWKLLDPRAAAGTPDRYRDFIRSSAGEFGLAKSGYVASRCAWFSDRAACFLAAGRPVVAQDTGFSRHLPTGAGLLAFDEVEDAADAIEEVNADYDKHSAAARYVAETHLDSDRVLGSLLERLATT